MEQAQSHEISNELHFYMSQKILEELVQKKLINEEEQLKIREHLIDYYQPELAELLR